MDNSNNTFIYSTGPNYIFVRFPVPGPGPFIKPSQLGGTIYFLGTAEEKPEEDLQAQYLPIFNNIGGKMVPFEKSYQGTIGGFSILLNKFSHTVLTLLQRMPSNGRMDAAVPAGQESHLSRGRLVQANGDGFELWRANGFFGTLNATAYPDLPPGRYYPCCHNVRIFEANEGLPDEKILLIAEPQNVYNAVDGSFYLYSEDPAKFAGLPNPI
jgi:hypothetical protein